MAEELEELQQKYASPFYLRAKKELGIGTDRIPQLTEMNRRLKELTGFRLAPIEGLVETRAFLSWLSHRVMLCTQYIRHHSQPAYTPEPDIVHEAIGHIPMFTNPNFADYSQFIGHGARIATDIQLEELGRLYWFTVEFGMMRTPEGLRAYGAGIVSSPSEAKHAVGGGAEMLPFDLMTVLRTPYRIDILQPVYFVIDGFDQIAEALTGDIAGMIDRAKELGDLPARFEKAA